MFIGPRRSEASKNEGFSKEEFNFENPYKTRGQDERRRYPVLEQRI